MKGEEKGRKDAHGGKERKGKMQRAEKGAWQTVMAQRLWWDCWLSAATEHKESCRGEWEMTNGGSWYGEQGKQTDGRERERES
jgi:hypothetical protein